MTYNTRASLYLTRKEIIDDLSQAFCEQNDITAMSDADLITAWKRNGDHAGTWDWDYVEIERE